MKKLRLSIQLLIPLLILLGSESCKSESAEVLSNGEWVFTLHLSEEDHELILPFNVEILNAHKLIVKNAGEAIEVTEISYNGDSVSIIMPVFGSEFKAKFTNNSLNGFWHKYNISETYKIPFTAEKSTERFKSKEDASIDASGKWQSKFITEKNDTSHTIGLFEQKGNYITGTFLTELGDYRYLEGIVQGNRLKLSTFDGAHAFLFEADVTQNSLDGFFQYGNHWNEKWQAEKTDNAVLEDMKKLTYLKDGYDRLSFEFPDIDSNLVSLEDAQFQNKVIIVQIFGTWCPNCMDETKYLVELYNKFHEHGLEIIALDFEPKPNMDYFRSRAERFIRDLNVPYPVVLAGSANKIKAAEALPMLNKIISYPTMIILNRKKEIIEIHTGFTGPGAGNAYKDYTNETDLLIQTLLKN